MAAVGVLASNPALAFGVPPAVGTGARGLDCADARTGFSEPVLAAQPDEITMTKGNSRVSQPLVAVRGSRTPGL